MVNHLLSSIRRGQVFLLFVFMCLGAYAQSDVILLYVGESYTIEKTGVSLSEVTSVTWEYSSDYFTCEWTGFKATVKPTRYFTGTKTVVCRYVPIWAVVSQTQTYYISCIDNPVSVSPTSVTLYLDGTKTQQLTCSHENNTYASLATITYNSSSTAIATVSSSGKITAKGPGTTKVYAHSTLANDENAPYCEVTVKAPTITLPKTKTINIGSSSTITPTHSPGSGFTLTWKSSNTTVATVSSTGKVTAKKKGTARITATITGYENYEGTSDYCDVTVTADPTGAYFDVDTVTLVVGQTVRILPIVTPEGAEYSLTWASNNTKIAKPDANGTVTARMAGTTKIKAGVHALSGASDVYPYPFYYVTVIELKGDVNGDFTVNIEDVTALIYYLLNGNASGININNADVDGDGHVNISDVTELISILLNS